MVPIAKFIQIAAMRRADGNPVLYALNDSGGVWWLSPDESEWRPVSDRRAATPQEPVFPPRKR